MKTYYELLGVEASAPPDQVKRAFRREIARYHPDKVQHLGPEFQEIAATRAAELTEAYRVLMDSELRRAYDESLSAAPPGPPAPASNTAAPAPADPVPRPEAAPPRERHAPMPETVRQVRATMSDVVRKATLARLREAVGAVFDDTDQVEVSGFDAAFAVGMRRKFFKRGDRELTLLVKVVPEVTGEAIEEAWPLALKLPRTESPVCLLLLGSGLSPARDLAAAISHMRRRSRNIGPVVIPVDVRDWEALFPSEAPVSCRSVIDRLKQAG